MVTDNAKAPHSLTVYKASAGSGKTFTLATEYIKLLVANPQNYRAILAVTFTNKATEEMKMRILSQLYGIWQQLPDSDDYLKKVMAETGLGENLVRQRAKEALHLLLHNYHNFRVQTIDAFFQSVLRNLARELNLTANLQVGLNSTQAEEMAVDIIIENLKTSDPMLQWLLDYVMDDISQDKGWSNNDTNRSSILHNIKYFGKQIFSDKYKQNRQALNEVLQQKGFAEAYIKQLRQMMTTAEQTIKSLADDFFNLIADADLTIDDFKGKNRSPASFFVKLRNGELSPNSTTATILAGAADPSAWATKSHPRASEIVALATERLTPMLNHAIGEQATQWKNYSSARLTLAHLNNLRLLNSIEHTVRLINEEENTFLLNDTQHLLNALIGESDTPFIFEKIGAQLRHIMIDEFQDTSTIQWENFRILLLECMSHADAHNLIVGDVKQSIYRWRSGDWRLLNNIEQQFLPELLDVKSLDTNYRSFLNVINFNNAFFTAIAQHEANELATEKETNTQQLEKAYSDVCQLAPSSRAPQGRVELRLLPLENYAERTLQMIEEHICQLLETGVRQKDMAILVRKNNAIEDIANHLTQHLPQVNIVSSEAFRLDASTAVCLMVESLHLLTHPDDNLAKANLVKLYQQTIVANEAWSDATHLIATQDLNEQLPSEYIQHADELIQMPLLELIERLYDIFHLNTMSDQNAYICYFFDLIANFTTDKSACIDDFIERWQQEYHTNTIQSDQIDGIRIMTIHKSKGLEFDYVMIPFCDWMLEQKDVIWCRPGEQPFSQLPLALIDYSKKGMAGSIYENDYLNEHLQYTVDNLNLLYVAFTRAAKDLFVIGKRDTKSNSRSKSIESVLPSVASRLDDCFLQGEADNKEDLVLEYGTTVEVQQKKQKTSDNVFLQTAEPITVSMQTFHQNTAFRQSNKSREFVADDEETDDKQNYIKTGNILHHVFSTIHTANDIDQALTQLEQEGIIYDQQLSASKLSAMLRQRLQDPKVAEWFAPHWTLYNECTILSTDNNGHAVERRPDRVMTDGKRFIIVDFKFGRPKPEYQAQVKEYIQLLHRMGHQQVEGYLWYVYTNKIEPVR